jgi:outer membrane protein TolC
MRRTVFMKNGTTACLCALLAGVATVPVDAQQLLQSAQQAARQTPPAAPPRRPATPTASGPQAPTVAPQRPAQPAPTAPAQAPPTQTAAAQQGQEVLVPGAELIATPNMVPDTAMLNQATLTLSEAVRLTMQHDSAILHAQQALSIAESQLRETRGQFDPILRIQPGYSYHQQALAPGLLQFQKNTRSELLTIADTFDALNKQIAAQLTQLSPREPFCPAEIGFESSNNTFNIDRKDPAELGQVGLTTDFLQPQAIIVLNGVIETSVGPIPIVNICRPSSDIGLDSGIFADLWRAVGRINNLGIDAIIDGATKTPTETLNLGFELSEAIATRARLALIRLGAVPDDMVVKSPRIEVSVGKRLRNGMTLSVDARLNSTEQNFKDKNLDPTFGGFGQPTTFPSFFSGTLTVPFGKGRGKVSADAGERAAQYTAQASRDQLRQTVSSEVFRTVLAYYNLVAAQNSQRLLEESATRQNELVRQTNELIAADEAPRAEINRAQARLASVTQSLEQARLSVLTARVSLVDAIGMNAPDPTVAPVATDALAPELPELPTLNALLQIAQAQRRDPLALQALAQASGALAAAATSDLKRSINLQVTAGLSTQYESQAFRFLPDEVDPIYSDFKPKPVRDDPVRYFSAYGWLRSLRGQWLPFTSANVTFDLPFGNHGAIGRVRQARAAAARSTIQAVDLNRTIAENVTNANGLVRTLGAAIKSHQQAVTFQQQTLDGALQRLKIGDVTVIDTITTEEDLTQSRLQLVRDQQAYMSALARLKFETGTLIEFRSPTTPSESVVFTPLERFGH